MEKVGKDSLSKKEEYNLNQANNPKSDEGIFDKLQKGFDEIDESLNKINRECIVVFIGFTGTGKTSIICYLNGETLKGKKINGGYIILEKEGTQSNQKIGNSLISTTSAPDFIDIEEQTLVDLPGLLDNRDKYNEFHNLYSINKIFEKFKKIKVVLVIDSLSFQETRADRISDLFKFVDDMFPNKELLSRSLSVVVTKCEKDYTRINFCSSLIDIKEKEGISEGQLKIIEFIIKNEEKVIALFHKPDDNEKLKYTDEIIKCINLSQFNKINTNFTLTHKAKFLCLKLTNDLIGNLSKAINELYDLALDKLKRLRNIHYWKNYQEN